VSDIAVDTSAIVEVFVDGPAALEVRKALNDAALVFVTSASRVETALVMMGRFGWDRTTFEENWQTLGLAEVAVSPAVASLAIDAFESWGKGRRTAGLNFGDCFSHALAIERNLPLLFVGQDFSKTGIQRV
jgi:ribonuclease VapC